jgi:hypothetical protein
MLTATRRTSSLARTLVYIAFVSVGAAEGVGERLAAASRSTSWNLRFEFRAAP